MTLLPFKCLYQRLRIDWQLFVWIDNNTKQAGVCLKFEAIQLLLLDS